MFLKRAIPLLLLLLIPLMLTGCFRQATDTFDTVDSTGADNDLTTIIETVPPTDVPVIEEPTDEPTEAPTDDITVIDPNDTVTDLEAQDAPTSTPTLVIIDPNTDTSEAPPTEIADAAAQSDDTDEAQPTATIVIIEPTDAATAELPPTTDGSVDVAGEGDTDANTDDTFITPVVESEFVEPTPEPTATEAVEVVADDSDTDANTDDEPITSLATPTAIGDDNVVSSDDNAECEFYTIVSGDTLFNIALANDTNVTSLRELNDLDSNIIRPGDELLLFPCEEVDAIETPEPDIAEEDITPTPAGTFEYTVTTGDTLYALAIRYGTSIDAIAELNELDNPNAISPGDVLLIPED